MKAVSRYICWLVACALTLIWVGCDEAAFSEAPCNECVDSLDCAPNEYCHPRTFCCEIVDTLQSEVDFELIPMKGAGTADTQIPDQDLTKLKEISDVSLELATAVEISGTIISIYAMGGVPGTLLLNRHPDIDNRRLVWNIDVNTSGYFASDDITPGVHDILFKPSQQSRENFPQLEIAEIEILPDEEGRMDLTVALTIPPYPPVEDLLNQDKLLLVRGQILESQTYPHPVTGIEVEGITEHGLRTSLAQPDEQGNFYLRLPVHRTVETNGDLMDCYPQYLNITIRPIGDRRLPTVELEGVELDNPDLGVFYMGEEPTSFTVSGSVLDLDGNPVPECRLRFAAEEAGNGVYRQEVNSQSDGAFSTNLLEGTYKVTAIPPLFSEIRMDTITLVLFENTSNLVIMLPNRRRLFGSVNDGEGNKVADVIVRAKRLSEVTGAEDDVVRTYEGITESNGTFGISVDSGLYNVTFIPPAASGLPRLPRPQRVYITNDGDYELKTTLPPPAVVQGHTFNKYGNPQCDVTINVYNSTETNAYLIGQTISDSPDDGCTGAYTVIIPAELVPEE